MLSACLNDLTALSNATTKKIWARNCGVKNVDFLLAWRSKYLSSDHRDTRD